MPPRPRGEGGGEGFWRTFHLFIATLLILHLFACDSSGASKNFFPLEENRSWTYNTLTQLEAGNSREEGQLTLSNRGKQSIESGSAWRRHSNSGVDYWLRRDETGIYRVASKSDLDEEPKLDKDKRHVLKEPLTVGTNWQASTTAYLLHRRQDFPREIRHSHPNIPMNYSIASVNQSVSTTAGAFTGCIHVKGLATVRLFADPVQGWRDMPLSTDEWYCPGVGLVKLERDEPATQSTFLGGGKYSMELAQWK